MRKFTQLLLVLVLLFFAKISYAQDYKVDYTVEYFIQQNQESLNTNVKFAVETTNLRSDVFVKKFSLRFPKSFTISNLKAEDDNGSIEPVLFESENENVIELTFSNPKIGKESSNNFLLRFDQSNLFEKNGSIWEVILPTIENRGEGAYQILVHLPDSKKKISVAKPLPDNISGNTITWNNPKEKTLYAAFGDKQNYFLDLRYNLQNNQLTSQLQEIAFPPDTTHQKVIVESLNPKPEAVYVDEDGNYLARYQLNSKETKTVRFNGLVEVSTTSRDEVKAFQNNRIPLQEKYLLTENKFWGISNAEKFKQLKTAHDIYSFLVQNLSYDYKRATTNTSTGRLGAETALQKPKQAVCVEFTDTFIALAREKGILTREIQGYAISHDARLRPLSLLRDVLHSWPEYYDKQTNSWTSIDPTWENTSGIDYFTSLDLNHIAFVIHGKSPEYPYPAGFYKTGDTKDVSVEATDETILEKKDAAIEGISVQKSITDTNTQKGIVIIKNTGNVFLYSTLLTFEGKNVAITPAKISIDVLAPLQEKKVEFSYQATLKRRNATGTITAKVNNTSKTVTLQITPVTFSIGLGIAVTFLLFFVVFMYLINKFRRLK
ncbi:hypothetical protein A3G67_04060 [Candidatus Roizmanbacteria bacterium RIFCSPLOWO2_12_FULL_40_12]|nr:MAG: hypothetical protein A3G67_04060 [Candidatus Roizmanbacteria bacterium RIFCSPLOWO2_12_FULL_40_12]